MAEEVKSEVKNAEATSMFNFNADYYARKIINMFEKFNVETEYSYAGIKKNVDEWLSRKEPLFNLLRKHPDWHEEAKAIITKNSTERRPYDVDEYKTMIRSILDIANTEGVLNYYSCEADILRKFRDYGACQFLTDKMAEFLNTNFPDGKFKEGGKVSRALGKIFKTLGIDKCELYNTYFARLSDAINPTSINRTAVLSVNILDFLLSSHGNSWSSCHGILPNSSYGGCYKAGNLSYSNDGVSLVFYTLDNDYDGEDWCLEPKISRQLFFYEDGYLLQSRCYPAAGNQKDVETQYRQYVEKCIATCEGVTNHWIIQEFGIDTYEYSFHYRDYECNNCNFRFLEEASKDKRGFFEIGGASYCFKCGDHRVGDYDEGENAKYFTCYGCRGYRCCECGRVIYDEDERVFIDGDCYCTNCCRYCDHCDEYHFHDEYEVHDNRGYTQVWCAHCVERDAFYCDSCGEYFREDCVPSAYTSDGYTVCPECFDNCPICDGCGEIFYSEIMQEHDGDFLCSGCYDEICKIEEESSVAEVS